MKASVLSLVLLIVGTQSVMAQPSRTEIKRQMVRTIQDIRSELALDVATDEDLNSALLDLQAALDILRVGGGGHTVPPIQLQCISRDNDGHEPYMFGRKNEDFSVTPVQGSVLSLRDCQASIAQTRRVSNYLIACTTRDSDANAPYMAMAIPNSGTAGVKFGVFGGLSECLEAVGKAPVSGAFMALCTSRDNDGRAPFVKMVFSSVDGSTRTNPVEYRTLQNCFDSEN